MSSKTVVESVKAGVADAKTKVEQVAAHGQEAVKASAQVLAAAKEVVDEARRDTAKVLSRSKDKLKKTLKEGAAQVGDKLANIANPTRREQAAARKAEVKSKKKRSKLAQTASDEAAA
jgi:hypothetical protein